MTKAELRRRARTAWRGLDLEALSRAVGAALLPWLRERGFRHILLYHPLPHELNLLPLMEAYPALAAVLEERLPQEAVRLYLEAAKARVEAGGRAAYREAAGLLGRLARLDPKRAREAAWGLVRAYPRRRALREELAPLLGSLHEPHEPRP